MANKGVDYLREMVDSLINGKENKKKKQDAISEIDKILDAAENSVIPERPKLPDTPTYDRLEYNAPTDEELRQSAENELSDYKNKGTSGIDSEIETKKNKYEEDLSSAAAIKDEAERKTQEAYAAAVKNTDSDMLKRGIARSSIAANKRAALESESAETTSRLNEDYAKKVSEISEKISSLRFEREKALNDFNISYAAKLSERISELSAERDKKTAEALKYNNSLTEKEYGEKVDKEMKESDLYSEALSQKEKEEKLGEASGGNYGKVYAAIADKLISLNVNDARDIVLNNPRVRGAVGNTYYYYRLYDEFCR